MIHVACTLKKGGSVYKMFSRVVLVKVHFSHLETFVRDGLSQSSRVSLYTLDASLRRSEHTGVAISLPPVAGLGSHILHAHNDRTCRNV